MQGLVQSLKKDRTGLKVNDKWYSGEAKLDVNSGDTIEYDIDPANPDKFGNPSLKSVTVTQKAQNPFRGGGNAGTTAAPARSNTYTPRTQDPETTARIARSHAITTAVAILGQDQGLKTYVDLADKIKAYTETGSLAAAKAKPKAAKEDTLDDLLEDL